MTTIRYTPDPDPIDDFIRLAEKRVGLHCEVLRGPHPNPDKYGVRVVVAFELNPDPLAPAPMQKALTDFLNKFK